jgi:RNA polymerase sigma factor (TIGR02999 family)
VASQEITELLISIREGDRGALDRLVPLVYRQLHAMAGRALSSQRREETLDTTALVHEAYLKIQEQLTLQDRRHFFAVAATAMRQIVIDHARRRQARKHGGGLKRVDLDTVGIAATDSAEELLALDEALSRLSELDDRAARVVELRFFGGLSVDETAEVLDIDPRTVDRDWRKAKAFLQAALSAPEGR